VNSIRVPSGLYFQTRFFNATRALWRRLADIETAAVRDNIASRTVDRPLYVTGMPRAGTTILTEMLAQHPDLTCHRYSDFPNVWTPYWRNYLLGKSRLQTPEKKQRAHGDRILVSNDSPEAVEEPLWMYFFPSQYDPGDSQVMDGQRQNAEFDRFYTEHILKLLEIRNAGRYLAKGNYNLARIRYLLTLFPDARFLIPVRDPVHQVASLARQHALFSRASEADPRIPRQLAMSGHFEFGPRRAAVNFGDNEATRAVTDCWRQGRETEGWARYWAQTYGYVLSLLENHPGVREACLLFRYEDLCAHSASLIDTILAHCELPHRGFESTRAEYIARFSPPDYYSVDFNEEELDLIDRYCTPVNEKLSKFCQNP
jgi:hypothetical protein